MEDSERTCGRTESLNGWWRRQRPALITAVILCVRAPAAAAQIITLELAVMTALYIGLTAWRYCKLRKLSDYLHDLSDGGTSLVLEDYKEGGGTQLSSK